MVAHDDVTHGVTESKILKKICVFYNANWINSANFNDTILQPAEKFGHTFLHLFIFRNIFAQGQNFDSATVTRSLNIIRLPSLIRKGEKPLIFLNIWLAVPPWVTPSWTTVFLSSTSFYLKIIQSTFNFWLLNFVINFFFSYVVKAFKIYYYYYYYVLTRILWE